MKKHITSILSGALICALLAIAGCGTDGNNNNNGNDNGMNSSNADYSNGDIGNGTDAGNNGRTGGSEAVR